MRFSKLIALPKFPRNVILYWEIDNPNVTGRYAFTIEYAATSQGPFTEIATVYDTFTFDIGYFEMLQNEIRNTLYFKVTCTPPIINKSRGWVPFSQTISMYHGLQKGHFLKAKAIARKESLRFEKQVGIPITILKRRTFGDECTSCINELTGAATNAHCLKCYGTRYLGGYFPPVRTYGEIVPAPVSKNITSTNTSEDKQANLRTTVLLLLNKQDIIIDEVNSTRYYVVMEPDFVTLRTFPLTQSATLLAASIKDVVYDFPLEEVSQSPGGFYIQTNRTIFESSV